MVKILKKLEGYIAETLRDFSVAYFEIKVLKDILSMKFLSPLTQDSSLLSTFLSLCFGNS